LAAFWARLSYILSTVDRFWGVHKTCKKRPKCLVKQFLAKKSRDLPRCATHMRCNSRLKRDWRSLATDWFQNCRGTAEFLCVFKDGRTEWLPALSVVISWKHSTNTKNDSRSSTTNFFLMEYTCFIPLKPVLISINQQV
jgi:hypothetical protein